MVNLRLRSKVTALEIGGTRLLFEAWHVNTICKCFLSKRSNVSLFRTVLSDKDSHVSSSRAFSCHHVTRGVGRPKNKKSR